MHAFDLFVDTGEPLRDIALDIGCQRRQAELDRCRQPRVGAEGRHRVGRQWRLVRRIAAEQRPTRLSAANRPGSSAGNVSGCVERVMSKRNS